MNIILTFLLYFSPISFAKVLPDPVIGERCEEMAERRKAKYQYKERLKELIVKNMNIRRETPPQKERLLRSLAKIHNDLNQRRHLIQMQIANLEEDIIRKGCPGIQVGNMSEEANGQPLTEAKTLLEASGSVPAESTPSPAPEAAPLSNMTIETNTETTSPLPQESAPAPAPEQKNEPETSPSTPPDNSAPPE